MAVILVVEDDVFIREMAESMILDWGHGILSACDVPEALMHLRSAETWETMAATMHDTAARAQANLAAKAAAS